MEILSKKPGTFSIKGKKTSLAINPEIKDMPSDVVLVSGTDGVKKGETFGARLVVKGPGEYEVGGIPITGIKIDDSLCIRFVVDEISLMYLPHVPKEASSLEQFPTTDILLLGEYGDVIHELEPKMIVPFTAEVVEKMGQTIEQEKKLQITKEKLPQELRVVHIC